MHTALGNGVWSAFFSDNNGLSGNNWFNEFTGPGHITNYPCSTQTVKGDRSAAGSAIQLIAEAMKHSTLAEPIVFNSSPPIISGGYDALYGWKFYSPRGESAIILNLHENEQDL